VENFSPRLGHALVARGKIFAKAEKNFRQGMSSRANRPPRLKKFFAKADRSCLGSPWKNFRQGWCHALVARGKTVRQGLKNFSPRHVIAGEPSAKAGKNFFHGLSRPDILTFFFFFFFFISRSENFFKLFQ